MSAHLWLVAFLLAASLHLLVAMAMVGFSDSLDRFGGMGEGASGVEVGLGTLGSYADMLRKATEEEPEAVEESPVDASPAPPERVTGAKPSSPRKEVVKENVRPAPEPLDIPAIKIPRLPPSLPNIVLPERRKILSRNLQDAPEPLATRASPRRQEVAPTKIASRTRPAMIRGSGVRDGERAGSRSGSVKDYFSRLMTWLNRHKEYPAALKKAKKQGTVTLRFSINRRGEILDSRILKGSGFPALDQAALGILARAAPLPGIPADMDRDELTISVPVEYSLITNH